MSEPSERITLRYVPQFVCLAGECKENCCTGLRVELTAANHADLTALAGRAASPPLARRVTELVRLEPPAARTARTHATIDAGGKACPFLDPDWLCSIHRELGEEVLPDPCALFPRVVAEVHGRREVSATLACPEAARLCLTTDGAVDLVPLGAPRAKETVVRRHDAAATDPYVALFDDVRQACLNVMNADGVRPPVRLLVLIDLADRIAPFFHAGTTTFEIDALVAALESVPARAGALDALFARTPVADVRALHALKEMLIARLPGSDNERMHALVRPLVLRDPAAGRDVIAGYFHGGEAAGIPDEELRVRTLAAHARLAPHRDAQLDEHTRRFAINALVKDWYTARPTLGQSLRRLALRLALSRWATVTHPTLNVLTAGDDPQAPGLVDLAAVDAFQIVAKNIEHAPAFMDLYEAYLRERGLDDVAGIALLLRA